MKLMKLFTALLYFITSTITVKWIVHTKINFCAAVVRYQLQNNFFVLC